MANQAHLISNFLAHMPGGSSQWSHLPRRPDGPPHLKVFSNGSSLPDQIQRKVVDFMESLHESKLSNHLEMFNLVQFWAPIQTSPQTLRMSVWGYPFGVGLLSDGVCQYHYDCMTCIEMPCRDDGDPISSAFASGSPRYQHLHPDYQQRYGVHSRWALPLVELPTRKCHGVLEFVTVHEYRAESFTAIGPICYEQQSTEDMMGTNYENGTDFLFPEYDPIPEIDAAQCLNMEGTSDQIDSNSGTDFPWGTMSENINAQRTSRKRNKSTQNKGTKRGWTACSTGIQKEPPHKKSKNKEVTVRATYGASTVKFPIDDTIGFERLCEMVGFRFNLEADTFKIEYDEVETGHRILIPCDEDLNTHLDFLSSSNKDTMILKVSKYS